MDDELAVLEGHGQHLERAAGFVVTEIQGAVVGAAIRRRYPETASGLSITCRTRGLPILCFRAAWVNLRNTAVSYDDIYGRRYGGVMVRRAGGSQ